MSRPLSPLPALATPRPLSASPAPRGLALLAMLLLAGCRPRSAPPERVDLAPFQPAISPSPPPAVPPPSLVPARTSPTPAGLTGPASLAPAATPGEIIEEGHHYPVKIWPFFLADYEIKIADVEMSSALDKVLEKTGASLAVNGGFFDHEGQPMGLAVSGGVVLSKQAPGLGGGILVSDGARARLLAGESSTIPPGISFAIQCRPRLVVDGKANIRSDDGKRAERTALCIRDKGQQVDVVVVRSDPAGGLGPSLFSLGQFLAHEGCEGALNLDGGPSTGVAWREGAGPQHLASRGPVRHALTFARRRETGK